MNMCEDCGEPCSGYLCLNCLYRNGGTIPEREHDSHLDEDALTHMRRSPVVRLAELNDWTAHE
jgi:hypothetical protein